MKILAIFRQDKAMSATLPTPVMMEMVEGTHRYVKDLEQKGKITEGGFFAGTHGGFGVFDVSSLAEFEELIELSPSRPMVDMEIYPMLEPAEFGQVFGKIKPHMVGQWQQAQAQLPHPH